MTRTAYQRFRVFMRSPVGTPFARISAGQATCLMYHRITAAAEWASRAFHPNLQLFVAEEQFEAQMKHLSLNYHCISLGEAVERLKRRTLPKRSVIVTFDDGYRDNLLALPILKRYGVPATIFITTGAVSRERSMWWDEQEAALSALDELEITWRGRKHRWKLTSDAQKSAAFDDLNRLTKGMTPAEQDELMSVVRSRLPGASTFNADTILSWDEVRQLDREPLITIGAHTVDHHVMTQLTEQEIKHQLNTSRTELERRLGHPIDYFAYPFGRAEHAASREFDLTHDAGFACALTTRVGHWRYGSRLHALPRIAIDYSDTVDDFEWKLSGLYAATEAPLRIARAARDVISRRPFRSVEPLVQL